MSDTNILDKSMRSVFVGNIPYEATEEKLKDIFNEVGPVLSFKLVYDRETGKPKGYGFCEYKDQETALSAMRNLNGYEIGGRSLRVDNACTEKSRLEMQSLLAGPPIDNTYGEPVDADKAPEEISKAVASLPPEQMFELMKQMKLCIQNNPAEGKQMLLQNPQLAYALLQAQVVMRIVDPQIAVTMLHKANPSVAPLQMEAGRGGGVGGGVAPPPVAPGAGQGGPVATPPVVLPPIVRPPDPVQTPVDWTPVPPPPPRVSAHPPTPNPHAPPGHPQFMGNGQDMDMRALDPRGPVRGVLADQDLRIPPMVPPPPTMHPQFPPEHPPVRDPRERFQRDPRIGVPSGPPRPVPAPVAAPPVVPPLQPPQRGVVPPPAQQPPIAPQGSPFSATIPSGATDQEKAALIMQVLQLSDEQIAMLPPEQRQSILILKEQIAKSTQR